MEIFLSNKFGLGVSILIVIIYALPFPKSKKVHLPDAIAIFLATLSIFGGLKVARIAYQIEKCQVINVGEIEQSYIVVGALAIIWIAVNEIKKKFQEKYNVPDLE